MRSSGPVFDCRVCPGALAWLSLSALLLAPSSTAAAPGPPAKLALVVAVAEYPESSGYGALNTSGDLALMVAALRKQGFLPRNIRTLQDDQATREGIVSAFRQQLIERAEPGDVVVFHYSGHGHRITDDDGDEPDGYDEVLVPYGARARFEEGYAGEEHLRDDDLGRLVWELRTKLGSEGSLLISLDSCYSGSATRGEDGLAVRGVAEPLGPAARGGGRSDVRGGFDVGPADAEPGGLSPYAVFSAARYDQLAHETWDRRHDGRAVGALSLAMSRSLAAAGRRDTYGVLFQRVQAEMAASVPYQTPQLEGEADGLVLRGEVVDQEPYLLVTGVDEDGRVEVAGGSLIGVQPGTEVAFFPAGTESPDGARPLAVGRVMAAREGESWVEIDGGIAPDKLEESWAFVTALSFGDLVARVRIDPGTPPDLAEGLVKALDDSRIIRVVDASADLEVGIGDQGAWFVGWSAEPSAGRALDPTSSTADVAHAVETMARNLYLRRLRIHDPSISVDLDVVPATILWSEAGDFLGCVEGQAGPETGQARTFHPGDGYLLRLTNTGERWAWITVLELMADGSMQQLYPDAAELQSDNRLEPGESYLDRGVCFMAEEPFGTEVIKLFATRARVDFRPLLRAGQATTTRGDSSGPLDDLLYSVTPGTRSARLSAPTRVGSVDEEVIQVVPEAPH